MGVLPGTVGGTALAVNSSGEVAGTSYLNASGIPGPAFYWSKTTGIKNIGTQGATQSSVTGFNEAGQILASGVGYFVWKNGENNNNPQPLFDPIGLGSNACRAQAINNSGVVVGYYFDHDIVLGTYPDTGAPIYPDRACFWNKNPQSGNWEAAPLSPLTGNNFCRATRINNNGVIAGVSCTRNYDLVTGNFSDSGWHLVQWQAVAGSLPTLSASAPGEGIEATLINASGEVGGTFFSAISSTFFFNPLVSPSTVTLLGNLGGDAGGGARTQPFGLNDAGQMCGASVAAITNRYHAFYWDKTRSPGNLLDMGTLGGTESRSHSVLGQTWSMINNSGTVLGWSRTTRDQAAHAFVWLPASSGGVVVGGTMYDLNNRLDASTTLKKVGLRELVGAAAITDNGLIVGFAVTSNGSRRAFLLTPNP